MSADNVTPIRPQAGAPLTRREVRLIERFRQASPERRAQIVAYTAGLAKLPRGGKIPTFEEWHRARRAGAQEAIAMLREIADQRTGYCLEAPSDQDTSVIVRYLRGLAPERMEGFAAILTDFLGSALKGAGAPDVELFEQMLGEGRV